ncbi:MAG: hypothetical protein LIO49_00135 [Ruminococcus sp.]|nr:hypothetical protein [Ruminococcus sp.]
MQYLIFFNNANGVLTFFATLFSGISLISVIVVIAEWKDTHRPHLQATFDLVRGSQACIVIKNVGNVPAYLTSLSFNRDFVEQLDCGGQEHLKDRGNLQMTLFPQQQWILPLTTTTSKIFEFSSRTLVVSMIYSYSDVKWWQLRRKKPFKETSIINFDDYAYFFGIHI